MTPPAPRKARPSDRRQRAVGGSSQSLGSGGLDGHLSPSLGLLPDAAKGQGPLSVCRTALRPSVDPAPGDTRCGGRPAATTTVPVPPGFVVVRAAGIPAVPGSPHGAPLDGTTGRPGYRVLHAPPGVLRGHGADSLRGRPGPDPRVGRSGSEICFRLGHCVRSCNLLLGPPGRTPRPLLGACPVPGTPRSANRRPAARRAASTGPLLARCPPAPSLSALRWPVPVSKAHGGLRRLSPGRWCRPQHRPGARPRGVSSGHRLPAEALLPTGSH